MEKRFTEKVSDRLPLLSLAMFLTACGGAPTPAPAPTPVPIPSNPVPAITSISPTGATAGGATFTLTVSGTGFISTSVVRWNGNDRPTAFQDSTHMTAQIPASDIATVAAASVAVFNPVPGGGTSSAIPFAIIATVGGFNPAGSMSVPRRNHTATLLPNGEVLVAGGVSLVCCDPVPVSEIFDPKTNQFRNTGSMSAPRYAHTATLLPDGRVLLAGGLAPPGPNLAVQALSSAELYDPATGTFTPTGSMVDARSAHTGTLLPNGKVLVTGGRQNESFNVLQRAEIYDPATGGFTLTGNMTERRASHTAVLLKDGRVLVGGGFGDRCDPDGCDSSASAEIFDPASGTFTSTGSMANARDSHSATLLSDGRVLAAGGEVQALGLGAVGSHASVEAFDPATGIFSSPAARMTTSRFAHIAILLPNGQVLLAGGTNCFSDMADCHASILSSAELFDPASPTFFVTGNMVKKRSGHQATLLLDGRVLITGGSDDNSAELYE
ncbi:MAG: hypothetical protein DMG41_26280 [Acidobacteria bacterium]|nr:MAG: hypothetical protein DMG42_30025 [Acidobacteriota bacterium]PYT84767.1 MAG: hypothetical protein DMG41_26280 [Acidobacteriota bacterium]